MFKHTNIHTECIDVYGFACTDVHSIQLVDNSLTLNGLINKLINGLTICRHSMVDNLSIFNGLVTNGLITCQY